MATFFKWASKNIALTFFFGVEILAFLAGLAYVVSLEMENFFPQEAVQPLVVVITVPEYKDLVAVELHKFNTREASNYQVQTFAKEEALQQFVNTDDLILILPDSLQPFEMEKILTAHPHFKKGTFTFFDEDNRPVHLLYLFNQNREEGLASFFKEENKRHIVFRLHEPAKMGRSG